MGIGWSLLLVEGFKGASGADVGAGFWGDMAAWGSRFGALSIKFLFAAWSGRRFLGAAGAGADCRWLGVSMAIGFSNTESWKIVTGMPSPGMK